METRSRFSFLYSLPAVVIAGWMAFVCIDALPRLGLLAPPPYLLSACLEGFLTLQLLSAWRERFQQPSYTHMYILFVILFLRLSSRMLGENSIFWGLRAGIVHNYVLGFIGYASLICIHPTMYNRMQTLSRAMLSWRRVWRISLPLAGLAFFLYVAWTLRSYHITRDGFDWIERTTQPVWFLYMREPLTIGLYRWLFLIGWPLWEMTSFTVIGGVAVLAGVWWMTWFYFFISQKWEDGFDRLLAWLLAGSSGGMILLFFGHIEVYPVFIAGLMPCFYFAHRYLRGESKIFPVAFFFGMAFLLHLSAGWLLPAFFLLPFLRKENRSPWKDTLIWVSVFSIIQAGFWSTLILVHYHASPTAFLARLHETFFVGTDRAMFLPARFWFHPRHLFDLANNYVYFSYPVFLLLPIFFRFGLRRMDRETIFWTLAALGYFLYSFLWNPDRGYPEDWDLFSPLTLMSMLLLLHVSLFPSSDELSQTADMESRRSLLYITTLGTFYFSCCQIYFHHIIPFIPPQYR